MTDVQHVIISGIGSHTGGVEKWASERTLVEIQKMLQKQFGADEKRDQEHSETQSNIEENTKKQADEMAEINKNGKDQDQKKKDRDDKAEAARERHAAALQYKLNELKTHVGYERDGFMRNFLGQFGGILAIVGGVVDQIWASTMRASESFTSAYKAGAIFEEGLTNGNTAFSAFVDASINTGISLNHLADISGKYSVIINQVGIKRFGELTDTMQKYGARYAMTNIEAAEYLGEYMEQTRQLGNLERLEAYTSADALDKSIVGVRKFSSALGMSVSDFQKAMSDLSKNSDIRRVMANVSENSRPALLSVFAMWEKTGQTGIAETVKKMLESPAVMARETAKIGAWLGADAANSIHEFVGAAMDGTLSVENQVEMANRLTESLSRTGNYEEVMHMLSLFAASGDSTAIMLKDMMISAKLAKEQLDKNTAAEAADKAKFSSKVSNLAERLSGALDKVLGKVLTDDFVKVLSNIIDTLGESVEGFSRMLAPFMESFGAFLLNLPTKLGEWLYSLDLFMNRMKEWGEGKLSTYTLLTGGKTEGQERIEEERKKSLIGELTPSYKGGSVDLKSFNVDELTVVDRVRNRDLALGRTKDEKIKSKLIEDNVEEIIGKDITEMSGYKPNMTKTELYNAAIRDADVNNAHNEKMIYLLERILKSSEETTKVTKDNSAG